MLPPRNRGTVTYLAPSGNYDLSVSAPHKSECPPLWKTYADISV